MSKQVSGTHLRLTQVSVADSGEYVCRVTLGTATQEASVIVTVPSSAGTYYCECEQEGSAWGQMCATTVLNVPIACPQPLEPPSPCTLSPHPPPSPRDRHLISTVWWQDLVPLLSPGISVVAPCLLATR